jgi:PhnB protein
MTSPGSGTVLSCMLAVSDTPTAVDWYRKALGAGLLWSLGSVAGLEIGGAPFFLHQPVGHAFSSPKDIGTTTARVELFVDDPDAVIARAVAAGAAGDPVRDHQTPWGMHRQGSFTDPFGHRWLVGDKSPLRPFREQATR